jgi:hypothetical protein
MSRIDHVVALVKSHRIEAAYRKAARSRAYRNRWFSFFWPRHCRACGGWGTSAYSVNQSPLGSGGYWPETFEDPCPHCAEQGRCGRCGGVLPGSEEGEVPCPHCGWNFDDGLWLFD